jgi:hypothetical protein
MNDPQEPFWRELRAQLAAEEAADQATAEDLLTSTADTAEAMDPSRIEAIVAGVLQSGEQHAPPAPATAPTSRPARVAAQPRRLARTLTIAAAISLVPGLLIATALHNSANSQLMLRNTDETLDYRDAIVYLVDVDVDANSRNTCQLLIMEHLLWPTQILRRLLDEELHDPVLRSAAQEALYNCRQAFANDIAFTPVTLPDPMRLLIERLQDRSLPSALRTAAAVQLGVMMEQGAAAMLQGARTCSDASFHRNHAVARRKVVTALQ